MSSYISLRGMNSEDVGRVRKESSEHGADFYVLTRRISNEC